MGEKICVQYTATFNDFHALHALGCRVGQMRRSHFLLSLRRLVCVYPPYSLCMLGLYAFYIGFKEPLPTIPQRGVVSI